MTSVASVLIHSQVPLKSTGSSHFLQHLIDLKFKFSSNPFSVHDLVLVHFAEPDIVAAVGHY